MLQIDETSNPAWNVDQASAFFRNPGRARKLAAPLYRAYNVLASLMLIIRFPPNDSDIVHRSAIVNCSMAILSSPITEIHAVKLHAHFQAVRSSYSMIVGLLGILTNFALYKILLVQSLSSRQYIALVYTACL